MKGPSCFLKTNERNCNKLLTKFTMNLQVKQNKHIMQHRFQKKGNRPNYLHSHHPLSLFPYFFSFSLILSWKLIWQSFSYHAFYILIFISIEKRHCWTHNFVEIVLTTISSVIFFFQQKDFSQHFIDRALKSQEQAIIVSVMW